jgi:hypothetical protein
MNFELITIPKINDPRGSIAVIENSVVPFEVKRVYYLFDVPSYARRGGHAHKEQFELLIPLSGSFDVVLKEGKLSEIVTLNKPDIGLLIKSNVWRELENFSSGAVCLVLSSGIFNEADYIRNYDEYLNFISSNQK